MHSIPFNKPDIEPMALQIPDAARYIGAGRNTIYNLAKDGRLRIIKVRNRSVILRSELEAILLEGAK